MIADFRTSMDDPCSCVPGDGTNECERLDECYEAWHRFTYPEDER